MSFHIRNVQGTVIAVMLRVRLAGGQVVDSVEFPLPLTVQPGDKLVVDVSKATDELAAGRATQEQVREQVQNDLERGIARIKKGGFYGRRDD